MSRPALRSVPSHPVTEILLNPVPSHDADSTSFTSKVYQRQNPVLRGPNSNFQDPGGGPLLAVCWLYATAVTLANLYYLVRSIGPAAIHGLPRQFSPGN